MDEHKSHEVGQWLLKSQRDLDAARCLLRNETPLLDIVVYHCQQSAEKILKAYLTYQDVCFPKTHDLGVLVGLCLTFDSSFTDLQDMADILTPYAVAFRYPGDVIEPSLSEAKQALEISVNFMNFVISKLLINEE